MTHDAGALDVCILTYADVCWQARLRRRFACMHVEAPTSEELHFIYETVAVSMLRTFEPEVQRIAAPL